MDTAELATAVASNRTEELGFDVWDRFVIPPRLNIHTWAQTRKPRVVIGGRGCGKTMLLRYLSHESAFSPNRPLIDASSFNDIGIYWRADTQFASLLDGRNLDNGVWQAAFGHLSTIVLAKEVLSSLVSLARSNHPNVTNQELSALDFSSLSAPGIQLPTTFSDLSAHLDSELLRFEYWANDLQTPRPQFLPAPAFLRRLIRCVTDQISSLNRVVFFAYIDEYENLTVNQQRVINTWIKHSETPLVFNLAMKRNGFKTRQTVGEESLLETHDYRLVDLEDFGPNAGFTLFAAEILLLRLHNAKVAIDTFDPETLRDPERTGDRLTADYARNALHSARTFFPTWSNDQLVDDVFADPTLVKHLTSKIDDRLQRREETVLTAGEFLPPKCPPSAATIVLPALLARKRLSSAEILDEFRKFHSNRPNRFQQRAQWIHNIFRAAYLDIFSSLSRTCPIYSGFDTFCHMAHGNVRHFLELCHKALAIGPPAVDVSISVRIQAEAASQVAATLLPEVRSFGRLGNDLHTFLLRLGRLFALSQQRPSQSEPERTHFTIRGGEDAIDERGKELLSEAVKWSVLFEEKETKVKDAIAAPAVDYVLNPIYAPYFQISYRKGRKLELTGEEFGILSSGKAKQFRDELYRRFTEGWDLNDAKMSEELTLWQSESDSSRA